MYRLTVTRIKGGGLISSQDIPPGEVPVNVRLLMTGGTLNGTEAVTLDRTDGTRIRYERIRSVI